MDGLSWEPLVSLLSFFLWLCIDGFSLNIGKCITFSQGIRIKHYDRIANIMIQSGQEEAYGTFLRDFNSIK